jgi:hypothetical protein
MDWTQFTILIVTIGGLFFWNRAEASNDRRMFYDLLQGIKDEMKDFHGKLERQDADFKAHLLYTHKDDKNR